MTRKKAKPQHRETVSTEPVNEGGFYKMLWNSMENDLGDARGDPSPVNVNLNSPPVIILSDQDSPCEENICDRLALPLPIKEENLEIQSETLQPCSENSDRSGNRVNFSSQADEGGVTVAPPQEDSSSLAESKNSLPSVPDSTPQSTKNPPIPADVLPFPNQLNVANLPISKSTEAQHEDIPAVQPSNFNVSGENGDFRSVVGQNQVCEDSNELSHTKNTSPINSKEIQSTTNAPMTRTAAENTDEALSILKSLLNQSDSDDGDVDMSLCISGNACFNSAAEALQIERLETPSSTFVTNNEENSPNCNLMSDLPAPEAMDVSIVTPTICTKPRPSNDVFPIINNFVPSKIKIEPTLVQRSLKLMKEDLAMLYNDLLSCKVIFSKAEPITYESPLSPDVELIPQSTPLPKAICLVKMERLPDPFLNNNGVVMSDKTFKTWKSQIIKQRNEERFRHLKVWRRGRTLLWRECELAGMDRATYNEQVAFIKKHKLSESSSECEASSSDESHDEASDRVSDCEAESNFSADEQTTSVATSSPASSPIRPALERRLPISPRTKPGPRKGVKYKSAAAVADQTSKSGVACRDEYVVEHTTISDCNSSESTKVSALKITLRKTSFNKSEDEQEKTADSEADSENSFTVPARPSPKKKRNFVTKRTYRKPEELSKEAGPKLLRKENKYYMEDNQDNQALLGRRSDEVENFNLLEKWDIPFEPPTLFRSPRVASRLAQQKNKETFSQKWAKKAPPKVAERVSKEVKDVVEMMCTRTVEAMLCPDLTTAMSLESKQPLIEDLKVDEASDESFNEPMPVEKPEPPKPDRCSDPEPFGEQTMPETPAEPIAEPTNPSKEQGQLDKVEHHAVVLPTKPSENPPEPAESEPPSSFDDTASELEESKLGPTQNVVISQKVKNNRRRAQGWGARKRKKRSIMAAGSVEVAASGEVDGEAPQPASPASTQVPVVSEGPGQSPLESEDDVSNSKITVDKVHDSSNSANTSDSHVKPKNKRSGQVVEKRLRSKEENLTAATQSAVEQRVTRSKQPNLGLTPEILEKVVNRRKRSSGNSVSEDATDAGTKPRRQTRKSQRGSQVSAKQVDDAGTAANSSNTQVHEVSEGPGEIQAELGDHKAEEVITTRVLRGRSVQVNNLPAEAKYRPASCETQDRRKDAELESSKDEPKVPLIPDSPMSPTPEDNESAIENEPTLGRVTRAKKRLLREGPAFIACKQKDLENDAEEKVVDTDITKTELETKETESAVPRVLGSKEESEIQLDATEPKSAVHEDSVSLVIDFVIDQEVSAPIGRQIGTDSVDTMSDSAVQETQNFMNADLNAAVDANHTQISQPCPSPKMAVDVEPENLASDTSKDSASDLNSSSDRLAVLDVLNSIRSSIEPPKRNQKVKTPPLPTPSLPGCIDLPLESLILPDELDDFGDIGDLVVDEEFSEEENDDSPLAVRIKKIVQDQIQKKDDDDDSESIADRIKKIVQEQVEQDALSQVGGAVSKAVAEVSEKSQDETSDAKVGDEASKQDVEAEKQGLVPSEEAKKDLKKEVSQENKENVDKSKDVPPKRRDSIDEKTGLPTSLIQRLRDPRIRSKLLSQLEEAENTAKEKTPVTVAPSDEQIEVKTSKEIQPVGALRDPRGLRSGINDPRCRDVPAVAPTVKCVAPVVPHPVTLPTVVAVRRTAGVLPVKTPVPPIPTPAPPAAPVCNSSTPLKEPSDDEEEESLKRRPKKAKKEVDAELMYKSPLEDLNSEARPSYGRAPVRRIPRRETDGRRWDVRPRRPVNLEMPRFYPWSQPQPQGEHLHPEPWKTQPWFPGFPNPYQDYTPDPQAAVLETALVNLALLPKTTNLSARALVKVYQFFNLGNPQPVNIPPPAFDPKEEARTITMSDAMGEEMIDIVQLPRPTSGLTKEFFTDLPVHHSLDDIIQKPYTTLSEVMDEEIEIQNNSGLNFLAADDDYDEALVKWPVVQKSDRNVVVVNSAVTNKTKVELDDDPLRNILHQLPLLKEQYSMNNSQLSSIKNSPISSIKNSTKSSVKDSPKSPFPGASTPPPPKWGQDVDLRTLKTSPVVKDDLEPPKDWRNPSPPKKRTSSRRRSRSPGRRRSQSRSPGRRRSQSRSPRRRSPSRSPRRHSPSRSPRRRSTSRSPRRRSKSRSPRRRRSHSRSSGSHSRSSTPASRRSRSRSPYSRRSRSRSSERRRRRLKSRSPSYKRHSTSSSPSHRRHRR